jgi:hypothetical protein
MRLRRAAAAGLAAVGLLDLVRQFLRRAGATDSGGAKRTSSELLSLQAPGSCSPANAVVCGSLHGAEAVGMNRSLVERALEQAGVSWVEVPRDRPVRPRLGVVVSADEVVAALDDCPEPVCIQIGAAEKNRRWFRPGDSLARDDWEHVASLNVWSVYLPITDPAHQRVVGREYACEIEFWLKGAEETNEPTGEPTYVPKFWNRRTAEVRESGDHLLVPEASVWPVDEREAPYFSDVSFPVDIVYTWVDGNDPAWRARKAEVLGGRAADDTSPDADAKSRFEDHQELRYSLRSVQMYADFVRHIYLVTDQQKPEWLDEDDPRITLVDHRELFANPSVLPTFNSHAIEAQLHRIEGLAEHFIYMNDDFFFCRPVGPWNFFHGNGISKFFQSKALIGGRLSQGEDVSVDRAALNCQRVIYDHFGKLVTRKIRHAPYALRRSVLYEMEDVFSSQFDCTTAARVRSNNDLPVASSLYHYYAYITGRALPAALGTGYVSLGTETFEVDFAQAALRGGFDTLCVNDVAADPSGGELRCQPLFEQVWPFPSSMERRSEAAFDDLSRAVS